METINCDSFIITKYLKNFEEVLNRNTEFKNLPLAYPMFLSTCEYLKKIPEKDALNYFEKIEKTLELDAKLHLFSLWFSDNDWKQLYTEEELLEIIDKEKYSYYRELTGYNYKDEVPTGIIYMSEKNINLNILMRIFITVNY